MFLKNITNTTISGEDLIKKINDQNQANTL
jgi:hypothetical protein